MKRIIPYFDWAIRQVYEDKFFCAVYTPSEWRRIDDLQRQFYADMHNSGTAIDRTKASELQAVGMVTLRRAFDMDHLLQFTRIPRCAFLKYRNLAVVVHGVDNWDNRLIRPSRSIWHVAVLAVVYRPWVWLRGWMDAEDFDKQAKRFIEMQRPNDLIENNKLHSMEGFIKAMDEMAEHIEQGVKHGA